MLSARLARAPQHRQHIGRNRFQLQRFLNKLRQPILHAYARTQIAHQYRALYADQFHAGAHLVDRAVVLGRARFLAQAHERRAEQALQFRIFLGDELLAQLADRLAHGLPAQPGIQVGQLAESDRGSPARFHILRAQATRIVVQNVGRALLVVAIEQHFHELSQVARRYAGRFVRQEHALLARLRHFRPEHAVQDVGVRLHQNPGLAHLLFLQLQNRAQRVHLPAHVLHHLVDGVDLDLALLIPLQREADRHVLGRFHQQRRIFLPRIGGFRRQTSQQLLQVQTRIRVGLSQFLLDVFFLNVRDSSALAQTASAAGSPE